MTPIETKTFILGGRAQFTVSNGKGRHYSYRIDRCDRKGRPFYFISQMFALSGEKTRRYIGVLDVTTGQVMRTGKSCFTLEDSIYVAVTWAMRLIWREKELPQPAFLAHMLKCGRCGRLLAHPDSIKSGLGPECRNRSKR